MKGGMRNVIIGTNEIINYGKMRRQVGLHPRRVCLKLKKVVKDKAKTDIDRYLKNDRKLFVCYEVFIQSGDTCTLPLIWLHSEVINHLPFASALCTSSEHMALLEPFSKRHFSARAFSSLAC